MTLENLQTCDIGKENNGAYISTPPIVEEMDTKIEVEVEVNITEEGNSRGISI